MVFYMNGAFMDRLNECGRLLQVALDFTDLREALKVASRLLGVSRAVILEAGTPLIKSYGIGSVSIIRSLAGDHLVVADMKTMDTGALEVSLAASHGADASSVLAVAPRETISEAVSEAVERGIAIYGDLIGHPDPLDGVRQLDKLGVHIALLHVGVDVQRKLGLTAGSRAELVETLRSEFKGPIAVAGGIKPDEAGLLADAGASIVIIGSAITRSQDPRESLLKALRNLDPGC